MTEVFSVPQEEVRRDRYGRYLLPDPGDMDRLVPWIRTTTFAKAVGDTYLLGLWQQRMVAKGLTMRRDLFALAAAADADDRRTLDEVVEQAREAAGSATRANLGTALHAFTEALDRGDEDVLATLPDELRPDIDAYQALVRDAGFVFEQVERQVIVPEYQVAGTFDRLGTMRGEEGHLIVDLKTGRDLSFGWLEIAIQLAIYANAEAMWLGPPYPGEYVPMPVDMRRDIAYVIHLPVGEGRADLYKVDIAAGWEAAQTCAEVREWRARARSLAVRVPVARVDSAGRKAAESREAIGEVDYRARIERARSRADLSAIWREAKARGCWTPGLEQLGKARLRQIESAEERGDSLI